MSALHRNVFHFERTVPGVASGLRAIGLAGAFLLLVSGVVIGAGLINGAIAQNASNSCTTNCGSQAHAAVNATIESELFWGLGAAIGGLGLGLVFIATLSMMQASGSNAPRSGA
jgi:hypothetical protein